jgi:hypothetical protein
VPQAADQCEARVLRHIFRHHRTSSEAGGVAPHDWQPAPQERLKRGGVACLGCEYQYLVLDAV